MYSDPKVLSGQGRGWKTWSLCCEELIHSQVQCPSNVQWPQGSARLSGQRRIWGQLTQSDSLFLHWFWYEQIPSGLDADCRIWKVLPSSQVVVDKIWQLEVPHGQDKGYLRACIYCSQSAFTQTLNCNSISKEEWHIYHCNYFPTSNQLGQVSSSFSTAYKLDLQCDCSSTPLHSCKDQWPASAAVCCCQLQF